MKIAIITNTLYEEIIPLAKYLSKNVDVELFSILSGKGSGKRILFESDDLWNKENFGIITDVDKKGYIQSVFNEYIKNSFRLHALFFSSLAFLKFNNLIQVIKIADFFKKQKFDIIHFNGTSFLFVLLKFFLPKQKFILTTHDPKPHSGETSFTNNFSRFLINRMKKLHHIVHSKFAFKLFLKEFRKIPIQNIKIIPFGAHDWLRLYSDSQIIPNNNYILFFGRISKYKGIEVLLEASALLEKKYQDYKIVIAGKGEIPNLEKFSNLKNLLIINRYITNNELKSLIKNSLFVVCPYLDATQSGVVSSAYTFFKPIIATNVGALPEMVIDKKTGFIIPPNNSKSLADKISFMIDNNDVIKKFELNIMNLLKDKELSWDHIANQTLNVYKEIL